MPQLWGCSMMSLLGDFVLCLIGAAILSGLVALVLRYLRRRW